MSPWLRLIARLAVAGALLYTITRWVVSPAELLENVVAADPYWLLLAAIMTPVGVLLQWWKWRRLVQASLPEIGEADILLSLFTGFGLGLLTPGRLGELGRGAHWPGARARATALAAADRLASSLVTLVAGAAWVVYYLPISWGVSCGLAMVGIGVSWRRFGSRLAAQLALRWDMACLTDIPRNVWVSNSLAAIAFNVVFCLQMFCLLRATGAIALSAVFAIPAMFALKTLLPISFMDLGVREAAGVLVLGSVGVAATTAVQASLMLFGLNVLLPGVAGLLVLAIGHRTTHFSSPSQRIELVHVR
ncbi:MAG: lysylphosphatidylglycerol synthase domain-containing protein [bacterium]|nr:lysylphosphatidylglycerol synthase domain-containing protein [bacterium]